MAERQGNNSPGRAFCRLDYGRKEQVVNIPVLDKVKIAKAEVLKDYPHDAIGPKHQMWDTSVQAHTRTKYTVAFSDQKLGNTLRTECINARDTRTARLTGPPQVYDRVRDHTFTRGDATTGWEHTTVLTSKEKRIAYETMQTKSLEATQRATQRLLGDDKYISPEKGTARFNEELRKKKEDELAHRQALEAQFGPETARLMLEIEQMRKPPKYRIKGTAADVQAVLSLPEYPTGEFEPPKRKSSKASQEGGSVSGRTASEASVALSHSSKVSGTNV